jgi:hypothetical protein
VNYVKKEVWLCQGLDLYPPVIVVIVIVIFKFGRAQNV